MRGGQTQKVKELKVKEKEHTGGEWEVEKRNTRGAEGRGEESNVKKKGRKRIREET